MTQDYGAAQPIADWVSSHVYKPAQRILGVVDKTVPPPDQKKVDPSYHDDMVRKANESFQKQDSKPAPKTPPKYHKGTDYVPKTGPAILKKGEAVLNEKDAEKYRAKKGNDMAEKSHSGSSRASHVLGGKGKSKPKGKSSKKHPHRLTISHGKSGGHKVVHSFAPDENGMTQPDEEHILPDKASLMQHIDENTPDMPAPQAAPPPDSGASTSVAPPPATPPPGM